MTARSEKPSTTVRASTQNLNVAATTPLISPRELERELPMTAEAYEAVVQGRQTIKAILAGQDPRLLVAIGPCSIHDVGAAMDYARRLADLQRRYSDRLYIVMRAYFEKPRTTVGWKGLINDPQLDGTFDMSQGLRLARQLLIDISSLGLPTGTEMLDPITPQYIDDLIVWASIGARTTESQTHRQMASGLSMPVGYKNSTTGDLQVAIDAMKSARSPHHFVGIDEDGRTCVVQTRGNAAGHLILRGGSGKPNYDPSNVQAAAAKLTDAKLPAVLMIDCSHANSGKKHEAQEIVWNSIIEQRLQASRAGRPQVIIGAMIESNLGEGRQDIPPVEPGHKPTLKYGVSVTDECIGWPKTEELLATGYAKLG